MTGRPSLKFLVPTSVVLFLLTSYAAAYYKLVDCIGSDESVGAKFVLRRIPVYGRNVEELWWSEKWQNRTTIFFTPMHWVDRRLRPAVWSSPM